MKSVVLNNDLLKKALKRVKDVIDKKAALPILQNLLIKVTISGVHIIACDIEVTSIIVLQAESIILEEFDILLPFELLYKISTLSGSAPIEILADDKSATIKCSQDKYEIKSLESVDEFPKMPDFPTENVLKVSDNFVGWLNKALATVSGDSLRPSMTKICIDIENTSLSIVTTDANVLFKKSFEIEKSKKAQLIISPKVAKSLAGFEDAEISWNKQHLVFRTENITVLAQMGTEKFPNYKNVIPAFSPNVEFNRVDLVHALEKVSITAGFSMVMTFQLKSMIGTVRVASADNDLNRNSSVDLPADYTGPCNGVALNVENMLKLLNQIPFETIGLAIQEENKAVLLSSSEDDKYQGLIMPLLMP